MNISVDDFIVSSSIPSFMTDRSSTSKIIIELEMQANTLLLYMAVHWGWNSHSYKSTAVMISPNSFVDLESTRWILDIIPFIIIVPFAKSCGF